MTCMSFFSRRYRRYRCAILAVLLFAHGFGVIMICPVDALGEPAPVLRVGLPREGLAEFKNQSGDHLFDVVLAYVGAKENWRLEKEQYALAEGVEAILGHRIDLLVALPHTAAQRHALRLSKEALITTWAQVCLASGVEAQSLLDLQDLRVGIVRGDHFAQEAQRLTAGLDIACRFIEFNSAKEMFGALSSGWIQAGVADRLVVETQADAYAIVKSSIYFAPLKYHFATAGDVSPAVIEAVDYHLKQLKEDPASVYHNFIESVLHARVASGIPTIVKWSLLLAAAVFLLMALANAVLRRQVRAKTAALVENNVRLEEELQQRSRAEAALNDSEKQYRSLFDSSIAGIGLHVLEYDSRCRPCDYRITDINPAFSEHTGIAGDQARGCLGSRLYGMQPPPFLDRFAEVAATGLPQRFDTHFEPLGKHFTVSVFSPKSDHFVTVFEDISGRKQAENDLRRSEEKYRLLTDHATDGILIIQNHRICYGNPSACRIAGVCGKDLIDCDFRDFLRPEDRRHFKQFVASSRPTSWSTGRRPFQIRNLAGETLWVEITTVTIEWEERLATLCFVRDITQTKKLEEKLLESQKLQAIGTLAGGIAHDFNNLLSAIMGFTELTLHGMSDEDPSRSNLKHVLKASERARALIQRILTFSRQQKKDLKPMAIAPLVSESLQLLRASLPSTIVMETDFTADAGVVMTEPSQINQIVMNLCTNGAQAMEGRKGVLGISLKPYRLDSDAAKAFVDLEPGRYVCLSISDSGTGMDRETQKKIFDPYFTTKKIGEGTGLGLSMVHGIVKSLGGAIMVYSEPGKGSTFRVYLPVVEEMGELATAQPTILEGGSEHILLVDDEELVLEMTAGMLERLGYAVTKRISSQEALRAFEADPERFDLVITDQTMPGLTGRELAREIRRRSPDIPVVLCSGFSAGFDEQPNDTGDVAVQLHKPVLMQELASAIRTILAPPN